MNKVRLDSIRQAKEHIVLQTLPMMLIVYALEIKDQVATMMMVMMSPSRSMICVSVMTSVCVTMSVVVMFTMMSATVTMISTSVCVWFMSVVPWSAVSHHPCAITCMALNVKSSWSMCMMIAASFHRGCKGGHSDERQC